MDLEKRHRKPSFQYAVFVLLGVLAIVLGANKLISAPIEPMFLIAWLLIYPTCMHLGYDYKEIDEGVMESCKNGLGAILILLAVGGIIATWMASGTVPAIIYFGLKWINPQMFLLMTFVLCGLLSLACGTSWGTMGTTGIAMFAIGNSLGIPDGMTVGAIVSGAFLGDMLSPMGGSANVVSAVCGTTLMEHCKELVRITIPVVAIACGFYYALGLQFATTEFDDSYVMSLRISIASQFKMGVWTFAPIVLLICLLVTRRPAMLSMLVSALAAMAVSVVYQGAALERSVDVFWSGYKIQTGQEFLDDLLNRGGVQSMFSTACMMLFACGMIGAFNTVGILDAIVVPISKRIRNVIQLTLISQVIAILGDVMGTNTFSLLMTGSLMTPAYKRFNLHPTNLSKAVGATATVCCALIPWNISGIYVKALFGTDTLNFGPYALLAYLMPIMAFLFVVFHIRVLPRAEV